MFSQGFALLIGVGGDLPVTIKDAKGLRDVLLDPTRGGYPEGQVHTVTGPAATRAGILDAFDQLIAQVQGHPDATVIVYYSGHGGTTGNPPRYFLVPQGYSQFKRDTTAISGAELTGKIKELTAIARKTLVFLDCCHAAGVKSKDAPDVVAGTDSSGLLLEKSSEPSELKELANGSGHIVIASSRQNELSWTGDPYSIFTACLLDALAGKAATAADGYARYFDVMPYLFQQVALRSNDRQHPVQVRADDVTENFAISLYAGGEAKAPPESPIAKIVQRVQGSALERNGLQNALDLRRERLSMTEEALAALPNTYVDERFYLKYRMRQEQAEIAALEARIAAISGE